jgi:AraC-like DNA-binding protein
MKDGKEGIAEVAKRIINANFTSTECRVEKIAEIVDISRSQLYRAFMDKFGASPKAYIDTMRIDYAKKLLTRSNMTVSEISYSVGFCEPLYFSTAFRKASKMSPSEFRKKYKTE